jgi:hypothetical protein
MNRTVVPAGARRVTASDLTDATLTEFDRALQST